MRSLPALGLLLAVTACRGPEPVTAPDTPPADARPEVSARIGPTAVGERLGWAGDLLPPGPPLPTAFPPGSNNSSADAVNNLGVTVGSIGGGNGWEGDTRAVFWPGRPPLAIPRATPIEFFPLRGRRAKAYEISDFGDASGVMMISGPPPIWRSWLLRPGAPVLVFRDGENIADMNAGGVVLINRWGPSGNSLQLLARDGSRQTVGSRFGIALSDAGDILAREGTTYGIQRPNGEWTRLQVPTQGCRLIQGLAVIEPQDINIHRDVVGVTRCPGGFLGVELADHYFTTWDASGAATVHLFAGLSALAHPTGTGAGRGRGITVSNTRVAALGLGRGNQQRTALFRFAESPPRLTVFSDSFDGQSFWPRGISGDGRFLVGDTRVEVGPGISFPRATVWRY